MANLGNINFPVETINGNRKEFILADKAPAFNYEGGKRVGDVPVGQKLTLSLPGKKLMQVIVRIDGADQLPHLTSEAIHEANINGNFLYVELIESAARLYTISGEQRISASAKGVRLVESPEYIDYGENTIIGGKK